MQVDESRHDEPAASIENPRPGMLAPQLRPRADGDNSFSLPDYTPIRNDLRVGAAGQQRAVDEKMLGGHGCSFEEGD